MCHQLESQIGILFSVVGQLEQALRAHIELGKQVIIEIIAGRLKLHLSKMSEVIVCLTDQLLGCQEGVHKEATASDLARDPLGATI